MTRSLKVDYVRLLAFATNSSSVHTPLVLSGQSPEDYLVENNAFGWKSFVAASEGARRRYAATALFHWMRVDDLQIRADVVENWTGVRLADVEDEFGANYIDHQSMPVLPNKFGTRFPDRGYFAEFLAWITQPGLVVVGGHDNRGGEDEDEDEEHDVEYSDKVSELLGDSSRGARVASWPTPKDGCLDTVCRRDPGGFYALFDREHGTKVRMSFDPAVDMSKSYAPELVDLKITSRCNKECAICYQDSGAGGDHASAENLAAVVDCLVKLQVFEVALGGGEPTLHPEFWNLLKTFAGRGVVPNFTTRDSSWFERWGRHVLDYCGAFAYSVRSPSEVDAVYRRAVKYGLEKKVAFQYVVTPADDDASLEYLLEQAARWDAKVVLLGYKRVGRAAKDDRPLKPLDVGRLLKYDVGVDTAFVKHYREAIAACGVSDWSYKVREGAHSMYVDAVAMMCGPSSYEPEKLVPLPDGLPPGGLARIFSNF